MILMDQIQNIEICKTQYYMHYFGKTVFTIIYDCGREAKVTSKVNIRIKQNKHFNFLTWLPRFWSAEWECFLLYKNIGEKKKIYIFYNLLWQKSIAKKHKFEISTQEGGGGGGMPATILWKCYHYLHTIISMIQIKINRFHLYEVFK